MRTALTQKEEVGIKSPTEIDMMMVITHGMRH
jgi:hypothetical protein